MDIIDIMLARALTPQGQTETYVSIANAAAEKAEKAEQDAAAAIASVEAAADEIATAKEAANDLLEAAQDALETAQAAQINTLDLQDVDDEIKQLTFDTNLSTNSTANTVQLIATYPDDTLHTENVTKMYKSVGENEDGTMTQKAIKAALDVKADTTYVQNAIANIPSGGGGNTNLGSENSGKIVIVGPDGNIIASSATEQAILEALLQSGTYVTMEGSLGLEIDYENKSFTRTQEASNKRAGNDFNSYSMYGGRIRCNVADNGTITAFYGDPEYKDDGSNGQVMIYQPKFYYQRIPMKTANATVGRIIRKESLLISDQAQSGFKLHPLFKNGDEELDYVLLSAYEGSYVDNKLASIAGAKPASNMNLETAEGSARARGEGWHITTMEVESANQMLGTIEFGSMNGQVAIESGISNLAYISGVNASSYTGSTASLGNGTGAASSTINERQGTQTTYSDAGRRAISYRGMENPWGNIWRLIGGIYVYGNGAMGSGVPYICSNFNYNYTTLDNNYVNTGMCIPTTYGWINAMAFGSNDYDWLFIPGECEQGANSAVPVGDSVYSIGNLNGITIMVMGGSWSFQDKNGPFFYGCDRYINQSQQAAYSARIMFIPTKNAIYDANITKWTQHMGG